MEMLILLTVTDEEVFESFEIYLTRFKAKELELTILFTKALKVKRFLQGILKSFDRLTSHLGLPHARTKKIYW